MIHDRLLRVDLLRAFQVLEADELPVRVLAVAADVDVWAAEEVLAGVVGGAPAGPTVLHRVGDARYAARPAPDRLPDPHEERATRVARRIGEDFLVTVDSCRDVLGAAPVGFDYETGALVLPAVGFAGQTQAVGWFVRHRGLLVASVRAAVRAGCHDLAVALAARLWTLPSDEPDLAWAHGVAHWGAEAAIESLRPETLAVLLASSAAWFADADDFVTAEQHGIRESRIRRRLGAPYGIADALWRRADIYRRWGRPHLALDCYRELVSDYREQGDRHGSARALTATGVTLLESHRPDTAAERLGQAIRLYDTLPDSTPVERAEVLEHLASALRALGEHGLALRRLDEALSLLVDVDDQAAERIRRLRAVGGHSP